MPCSSAEPQRALIMSRNDWQLISPGAMLYPWAMAGFTELLMWRGREPVWLMERAELSGSRSLVAATATRW